MVSYSGSDHRSMFLRLITMPPVITKSRIIVDYFEKVERKVNSFSGVFTVTNVSQKVSKQCLHLV